MLIIKRNHRFGEFHTLKPFQISIICPTVWNIFDNIIKLPFRRVQAAFFSSRVVAFHNEYPASLQRAIRSEYPESAPSAFDGKGQMTFLSRHSSTCFFKPEFRRSSKNLDVSFFNEKWTLLYFKYWSILFYFTLRLGAPYASFLVRKRLNPFDPNEVLLIFSDVVFLNSFSLGRSDFLLAEEKVAGSWIIEIRTV